MNGRSELADTLGRLSLFADFTRPSSRRSRTRSTRRSSPRASASCGRGLSGSGFFVILEGQAAIEVDGERPWTLGPGDFFGEASVLTGEPPTADVVAKTMLRCVIVPGPDLERFLLARPRLLLRLLRRRRRGCATRSNGGRRRSRSRPATTTSWSSGAGPAGSRRATRCGRSGYAMPCSAPTRSRAGCSAASRSSNG